MYSKIKNVQIIVSLMKQHGIRHIVLSAGTRHVPIAHSVENDNWFCCHSVVDERSAAYYALGLAKELNEPVAIACTSSTATCNYTPAISEAYYQKVPLLILTGDRDERLLDQLEDQMINQIDMYRNFCKKCVNLPTVRDEMDEWVCTRRVNEAILELNHHGCGPVQINFQINQTLEEIADASASELPIYNCIQRIDVESDDEVWKKVAWQLVKYKRIMILCGSNRPISAQQQTAMNLFAQRFNCAFVTEYLSNTDCEWAINAYGAAESIHGMQLRSLVAPDLVIFYGGNFVSKWKSMLRDQHNSFVSWAITPDGKVMDPFRNLNRVFECSPSFFFRTVVKNAPESTNDGKIYNTLYQLQNHVRIPSVQSIISYVNDRGQMTIPSNCLTAFGAIQALVAVLPAEPLLHLSILNATRITQFFTLPKGATVYSNVGTDGIDGCLSTLLGQAVAAAPRPCYLIIGDLSFFYDMSAISLRDIGNNVRILLINNGGGAEFYLSMGPKRLPNIDCHVSAAHHHQAKEWAQANGFNYMTASNQYDFEQQVAKFTAASDNPILFEAFTDKMKDVMLYKGFQEMIRYDNGKQKMARHMKDNIIVQHMLSTSSGQKIKKMVKSKLMK